MTDAHLIRCVWTGDSPKAPPLDADTLRRILHYDPTIGEFTCLPPDWIISNHGLQGGVLRRPDDNCPAPIPH